MDKELFSVCCNKIKHYHYGNASNSRKQLIIFFSRLSLFEKEHLRLLFYSQY